MPSKSKTINPDKKTAMQTFNDAWKYLDKKKLSKEEKITLLNLVHTSYYFWQQVPESVYGKSPKLMRISVMVAVPCCLQCKTSNIVKQKKLTDFT